MTDPTKDPIMGGHVLPSGALATLQARVDKFNRRGTKRSFAPLTITVAREFEQVKELGYGRRQRRAMVEVIIAGDVPVIAGHTFLASVQHTPAGNLVRRAPVARALVGERDLHTGAVTLLADPLEGVLLPFREAEPDCAHCHAKRARKDTFVLRTPTGAVVQIGRNCLAQYIGSADPEEALRLWSLEHEIIKTIEEGEADEWGGGGGRWYESTADYLAHACAVIRVEGFRSSKEDVSTRSRVTFAMARRPTPGARGDAYGQEWDTLQPEEADHERAAAVQAWVAEQDGATDYMFSLRVACALPRVERTEGLLCAGVNTYLKAIGEAKLREARPATVSEHFGEVGKRTLYTFKVTRTFVTESQYGSRTIVGLQDSAGRVAVWFASGVPDLAIGDEVTGKATVKEWGDYKGTKQTVLSRFAFEKVSRTETLGAEA